MKPKNHAQLEEKISSYRLAINELMKAKNIRALKALIKETDCFPDDEENNYIIS